MESIAEHYTSYLVSKVIPLLANWDFRLKRDMLGQAYH
jgi:hypothetical protein